MCAGLADYFEIDAVWFRISFIVSLFFFGAGVIVYLMLAIILPENPTLKDPHSDILHGER